VATCGNTCADYPTQQQPSRAICCIVPIQPLPLS
jgi:hypothetical protein